MKTTELKENIKKGISYINILFFIFAVLTILGIILSFFVLTFNNVLVGVCIGFLGIFGLVLEYYIYKYILTLGQANVLLINAIDSLNPDLLLNSEDSIPNGAFDFKEKNDFLGFRLPNSYDVEYKLSDFADKSMVMIFTNYLMLKFYETSLDMDGDKQKNYLTALQYDKYLITEEALQNEVNELLVLDDEARIKSINDNIKFIKENYGFVDHLDKNYHKMIHPRLLEHKGHFDIII